jgi:hypothetical protein
MEPHILIVANRTAATPHLAEAVRRRAERGPCRFTLLVPRDVHGLHLLVDPEDCGWEEAARQIELAQPLLEAAAGAAVETTIGCHEPLAAVQDALNLHGFDEVIVSTLSPHVSRWLRLDLPRKVAALGVPVTTVTARAREEAPEVIA